jgi:hypothetical protein
MVTGGVVICGNIGAGTTTGIGNSETGSIVGSSTEACSAFEMISSGCSSLVVSTAKSVDASTSGHGTCALLKVSLGSSDTHALSFASPKKSLAGGVENATSSQTPKCHSAVAVQSLKLPKLVHLRRGGHNFIRL